MGQGPGIREFNRLYKELDDLYHNLALRQGLSDSASINSVCALSSGRRLPAAGYLRSVLHQQADHQFLHPQAGTGWLSVSSARTGQRHAHLPDAGGPQAGGRKSRPCGRHGGTRVFRHAAGGPAGPSASDARLSCPPAGRGRTHPVNFHIPSEGVWPQPYSRRR